MHQRGLGVGAQAQAAQAHAGTVLLQEKPAQQQHVPSALTQGRHPERVDAQAMIKVCAVAPAAHFFGQVAVGRCDQPYIDLMFLVRAQALQLPALQHPQQLGLHGQRQLAHFIQKQGAAVGQFELAPPVLSGARKGPAHMTEQLAFHQRIGQGGAVEADHRLVCPWRCGVNGLGHELLADTGLAGDQDGQVAAAHQGNFFQQALVDFALADQFLVGRAAGLSIELGFLLLILDPQRQPLDALRHIDRGCGQAGKGLQVVQPDRLEALGVQGIQGQQPPGALFNKQRAAHAVVNFKVLGQSVHQPVIGVGQLAIAGEARRPGAAEQCFKARVFADFKAAPQRIQAQAVHCQRHQPVAVQPQQGSSIAGEEGAQGLQQAPIALAFRQVARQVGNQGQQGREQGFCSHFDLI